MKTKKVSKAMRRLKKSDPKAWLKLVRDARKALGKSIQDDQPTTVKEASDLVAEVMVITGWTRQRVIAEGMFRILAECPIVWSKRGGHHVLPKHYKPMTMPDGPPARERYLTIEETEKLLLAGHFDPKAA